MNRPNPAEISVSKVNEYVEIKRELLVLEKAERAFYRSSGPYHDWLETASQLEKCEARLVEVSNELDEFYGLGWVWRKKSSKGRTEEEIRDEQGKLFLERIKAEAVLTAAQVVLEEYVPVPLSCRGINQRKVLFHEYAQSLDERIENLEAKLPPQTEPPH